MIRLTDRAAEVLERSQLAARRFQPNVRIRLVRDGDGVGSELADRPERGDISVTAGASVVLIEEGLEGIVDVEEPHDRLVLRAEG